MREVNVAIADDNERILDMLGEIIEQDQDLNLIGKADNGEDIYHLIKEKKPDVVIIAGDVYDRSAPSGEAIALLDHFLTALAEKDCLLLCPH